MKMKYVKITIYIKAFLFTVSASVSAAQNDNLIPKLSDEGSMKKATQNTLRHVSDLASIKDPDSTVRSIALYGFADKKLMKLQLFPQLTQLDLTAIVKRGYSFMQYLSNLNNLCELILGPHADDGSLKYLTKLPLRCLNLSGASLGGSGLEDVGKLKQLEQLDLSHTLVCDNSIMSLSPLINLIILNLESTRVSPAKAEELKEKINQARVELGLQKLDFKWTI